MKRIFFTLLFAALVSVGMAEQRIVYVKATSEEEPSFSRVERLLAQGWRIVHVAAAGNGSESSSYRQFSYVFVLERPDPIKP